MNIPPPARTKSGDTAHAGPGPRRAHSATLVGKDLYIFGGGDGRKALNDIFILGTFHSTYSLWACCRRQARRDPFFWRSVWNN